MEQSPSWEANVSSASQEIPHILWNPVVYYPIYKSPRFVPVLRLIQSMPLYQFLQIHFNIIHLCVGLPSGLFPTGFPTKTL